MKANPHDSIEQRKLETHPTVLVASPSQDMRHLLVGRLRQTNCLVLEADSFATMVSVVKTHSRPIHILLLDIDIGAGGDALLSTLNRYKAGMQVLFVAICLRAGQPDTYTPDAALEKVRELLNLTKRGAAGAV